MHRGDHAFVLLRPGDRQNLRETLANLLRLGPHAAGHDDLAILGQRRADRLQRLRLGAVEEAASVDDHHVGAVVTA